MTTSLTPMQTFEAKVKTKLKETIADMLPDDALDGLVQKAVEEEFFKPTRRNLGTDYQPRWEEAPSWFMQEVAKLAKPIIDARVKKEFDLRKSAIEKAIDGFCKAQNIALLMSAAITRDTSSAILEAAELIRQQMDRRY